MRVAFVFPNTVRNNWRIPLGLAYLVQVVTAAGHEVMTVDTTSGGCVPAGLGFDLERFAPEVVCFSVMSTSVALTRALAREVRRAAPSAAILMGGVHATIAPEELLAYPEVDFVCVGEGELSLSRFLEAYGREGMAYSGQVEGIWYKRGGQGGGVVDRGCSPLVADLDSLPFPARRIFDDRHNLPPEGTPILTARGCPFTCSYCVNPIYRGLYGKDYIRFRSIANVLAEMKELIAAYDAPAFFIQDETFFMNKARLLEFCVTYRREIARPFRCMGHAGQIDGEMLTALREAGCLSISIGIESGNSELRYQVLNRDITDAQLIEVFRLARQKGIKTHAFNIIGLPGETKDDIGKTLALNLACRPNSVQFSIMAPFQGTAIRKMYQENNWLINDDIHCVYGESMVETSTLTAESMLLLQRILPYRYYFQEHPLVLKIAEMVCGYKGKNPIMLKLLKEIMKTLDFISTKTKIYDGIF